MLKEVSKWLNFFGFKVKYIKGLKDNEILKLLKPRDLLITSDKVLYKRASKCCFSYFFKRREDKAKEIGLLIKHLGGIKGFMHCMLCGTKLQIKKKEELVNADIPNNVLKYHNTFFYCPKCKKYYWKGSHWRNIKAFYLRILFFVIFA